jgi:hypothetical protein
MKTAKINFLRVNNDVNGNPRYVCHYSNLLTNAESNYTTGLSISDRYNAALNRARKIGGRKFHNKQYGGGIVFQSYNIQETEKDILNLIKS